ncbi:glycoside hydrolase family 3 protein [Arenibacter sp. BSSL-BM3]|uniref:beta-N-acetylhexosaminidase n=1 Tax=Arenibacter arenosicollis TaxID=2762274 RepID=A0ABR7QP32_9FLAO|nr:glycoside hydrolase family 3 protein [Arenibacter arenosicollis]MBC8768953.1 glycoside hydrolase family 3 protein [Arenibacter arenosicollis]
MSFKIDSYNTVTNNLSLREKLGQLFMPAAFINDTEEEIQELENLIAKQHVGGLCFFHSRASAATNFEGKKKIVYNEQSLITLKTLIQRYQKAAKNPLLISIDAEWGLAMRIENTPQYPYAITLGAIQDNDDLIFQVGQQIARDCKAAGIHWNLAPVVDINNNPNNPVIGYRSFGEDKLNVTEKAIAFIKGTESEGILSCIKHFPGHGDTATDSHLGLPLIEKSKEVLLDNELYPFREIIKKGVDSVMVGHLSVPSLDNGEGTPATISKTIIKGLLRQELNFDGVVISDALNMHSVSKMFPAKGELEWRAFDAGNDIICFAEHTAEGIETILSNANPLDIEERFKRIWKLKEQAFASLPQQSIDQEEASILNKQLAKESLTLFTGNNDIIKEFKQEGFTCLSLGESPNRTFLEAASKISSEGFQNNDNVLIALYPPKVKPQNNFDLKTDELEQLEALLDIKNVILYVFGNPYVLNLINYKAAKAIVLGYQNFSAFQDNAFEHFLGKQKANGRLAVSINLKKN